MQTGLKDLLYSRKFWIMVLDMIISIVTYFTTKYVNPDAAKDVLTLIAILQPVILFVIGAITLQNIEGQKASNDITIK